jgi:Ca2+-binding RTX toxin-like protein
LHSKKEVATIPDYFAKRRGTCMKARLFVTLLIPGLTGVMPAAADAARPTCMGKTATIVGTSGNNQLVGSQGPDVIVASEGNDRVAGLGGNDLICLGRGND